MVISSKESDVIMSDKENKRVTVRVDADTYERLVYWSQRHECSINEYLADAIDEAIKRENQDYDLPRAEIARLNQLIDVITVLSSDVNSLEDVVTSGFESLLGLTRGDNYLLEQEDGEL